MSKDEPKEIWKALYVLRWVLIPFSILILLLASVGLLWYNDFNEKYQMMNDHLVYNFCEDKSGMQPFMMNCITTLINCTAMNEAFEEHYDNYCRIDRDINEIPDFITNITI